MREVSGYPPTKTPIDHPFVPRVFGAFERMHGEGVLPQVRCAYLIVHVAAGI